MTFPQDFHNFSDATEEFIYDTKVFIKLFENLFRFSCAADAV